MYTKKLKFYLSDFDFNPLVKKLKKLSLLLFESILILFET